MGRPDQRLRGSELTVGPAVTFSESPVFADSENGVEHHVTAEPIVKMDGGTIGYRFECSCGRVGNGCHSTEAKAIERGHDHV